MSVKTLPRKYANVFMTDRFIELQAYRAVGAALSETVPVSQALFANITDERLGLEVLSILHESRLLSHKESTDVAFTWLSYYQARIGERVKKFGYEDKYEVFQQMNSCFITSCDGKIIMTPQYHIELARWTHAGGYGITHFIFPENASSAELGAGLRLAFNSCDSKGDFDPNELPLERGQDSRLRYEGVGDVSLNYAFMSVYFEEENSYFMDVEISDDREIVFIFYKVSESIQLNLAEWDQIKLQAEFFLTDILNNVDAYHHSRKSHPRFKGND